MSETTTAPKSTTPAAIGQGVTSSQSIGASALRGAAAGLGYQAGAATVSPGPGSTSQGGGKKKKKLYFAVAYSVTDKAFERAAQTYGREVEARSGFDPANDLFLCEVVTTEGDFRTAWTKFKSAGDAPGWTVAEGQVFSHASKGGAIDGLEFKPGTSGKTDDDGTLGQTEIASLPRLNWASDGVLILSSCNSGLTGTRGWSPASEFASAQGVPTRGEMGYAYFSSDPNQYVGTDENTQDMYLNAYERKRNAWFGSGDVMPESTHQPASK